MTKIYYKCDWGGMGDRMVAAATKREAKRLLGAEPDAEMPRKHPDAWVALLVPGVAWKRKVRREFWTPLHSDDCEKVVRARFPDYEAVEDYEGSWAIRRGDDALGYVGYGADACSAWAEAFRRTWLDPPDGVPTNAVTVWRFEDAPIVYRDLSTSGGDEDWLAWVPDAFKDDYTPWLQQPAFGCCSVSVCPIRVGEIRIGAHA